MRPNQNTDHAKAFYHFTNKWKIRFDYRKSLHKKISLNALIFDWIKIYFLYKKPRMETKYFKYKYILIEYKYIFSEWQNLYITKIFFFSLNINIYNFLDKKNIEYKNVFLQHFSNHIIRSLRSYFFEPMFRFCSTIPEIQKRHFVEPLFQLSRKKIIFKNI